MTGRLTLERQFGIGRVRCDGCRALTPRPPQSVVDALVERRGRDCACYIWPFDHESKWHPDGWVLLSVDNKRKEYCPECAAKITGALEP